MTVAGMMLVACAPRGKSGESVKEKVSPPLTDIDTLERLVQEKKVRLDINLNQARASPTDQHDVSVSCVVAVRNFSEVPIVIDGAWFRSSSNFDLVLLEDGKEEQMGSLSEFHRTREYSPDVLSAGETKEFFNLELNSFPVLLPLAGEGEDDYYYEPGTFQLFHRKFPNDRLTFTLSEKGIIAPQLNKYPWDANN